VISSQPIQAHNLRALAKQICIYHQNIISCLRLKQDSPGVRLDIHTIGFHPQILLVYLSIVEVLVSLEIHHGIKLI
jgi:hypothetical protein